MSFKLSQRSLDKLEGVNPKLVAVVQKAILLTKIDFGVTYGSAYSGRARKASCGRA
jgi:peptidoglycan LD-endopeptidase CwlK